MKTQLRFKEGQDYPEQQNGLSKAFFHNPKYRDMSVNARYLYMIFTLRMTESQNKGWIDDDGNMYIIYSDEDLMKEMHCKSCTVDKLKKRTSWIWLAINGKIFQPFVSLTCKRFV